MFSTSKKEESGFFRIIKYLIVIAIFLGLATIGGSDILSGHQNSQKGDNGESSWSFSFPWGEEAHEYDHEDLALTDRMLGDIRKDAPDNVRFRIADKVHKAQQLKKSREAEGDYNYTDEESQLWIEIVDLLDEETARQLGEQEPYDDEGDNQKGKLTVLKNLEKYISPEDYKLAKKYAKVLMDDEADGDEYSQAEENMETLLGSYPNLDVPMIMMTLDGTENWEYRGVYTISQDLRLRLQSERRNCLDKMTERDHAQLKEAWIKTAQIVPQDVFRHFSHFVLGGDGRDGTLAFVYPMDDDGAVWSMNVDYEDMEDGGEFPYTVVHEIFHYMTLNDKQMKYYYGEDQFPEEGISSDLYWDSNCVARENSYLQKYYENFWKEITDEWSYSEEDDPYFYLRHKSEFCTEYASSDCSEDICEAFSCYVFMPEPKSGVLREKYRFFDSYPELRQFKESVLSKVKHYNIKVKASI